MNRLSIFARIRHRLGIFTKSELDSVAIVAFGEGKKRGIIEASEKFPHILAQIAEERLKNIVGVDYEKN